MRAAAQRRRDFGIGHNIGKVCLSLGHHNRTGIDHQYDYIAAQAAKQKAQPAVKAAKPGFAEAR